MFLSIFQRHDDSLSPVTMNKDSPRPVEVVNPKFQEVRLNNSYRNENDERSRGSNPNRQQSSPSLTRNDIEQAAHSKIDSHGDVPSQVVADSILQGEQYSKVTEVIDDVLNETIEPALDEEEEENHDSDVAIEGGSLKSDESEKDNESVTSDSKMKSTDVSSSIDWDVAKRRIDNVKGYDDDSESSNVSSLLRQAKKNVTHADGATSFPTNWDNMKVAHMKNVEAVVLQPQKENRQPSVLILQKKT